MRINYIAAMGSVGLPSNAAPVWQSDAGIASGLGAVTPVVPISVANDILLCFVQSSNEAIAVPTNSGAGTWVEVTNSPQGIGTAATAGSVRLAAFWMRYTTDPGTVTVADSGNHTVAVIYRYTGCVTSGNPWNITSGQTETGTTTTVTFPSVITTVANCLIVAVVANAVDSTTAQVTSILSQGNVGTMIGDSGNTNSGTGGGIDSLSGTLVNAGSSGTVQVSMAGSSAHYAEMLIALTSN